MPIFTAPRSDTYRITDVSTGDESYYYLNAGESRSMNDNEYAIEVPRGEYSDPSQLTGVAPDPRQPPIIDHVQIHQQLLNENRYVDPSHYAIPSGLSNADIYYNPRTLASSRTDVDNVLIKKIEALETALAEQKKLIAFITDTLDDRGFIR